MRANIQAQNAESRRGRRPVEGDGILIVDGHVDAVGLAGDIISGGAGSSGNQSGIIRSGAETHRAVEVLDGQAGEMLQSDQVRLIRHIRRRETGDRDGSAAHAVTARRTGLTPRCA
jgi:hypothetical protein